MNRTAYFENISQIESPLFLIREGLDALLEAREKDNEESMAVYLSIASKLESFNTIPAKTRGAFIRLQCQGIDTEDLFNEYSESWGIPKFEDDLVTVNDFKHGFLWTFRDHTTSWTDDEEARAWFYNHPECRFARRYEYYSTDSGHEELLLIESGSYKNILYSIMNKHKDYSPLISPVFTKEELEIFYSQFDEIEYGIDKKDIYSILAGNPNWLYEK